MKKTITVLMLSVLLMTGCSEKKSVSEKGFSDECSSAVWITYSEINKMLLSEAGFEYEVTEAAEKCRSIGASEVYIHVRSHCDSLFKSEYFPLKNEAAGYDGDAFEFMLSAFHSAGIRVHAWINPYRVSTKGTDTSLLDSESPAYKWLNDSTAENDSNVCFYNGIYLNPGEAEVIKLITDGVKEIAKKYSVDGIHFDDYFYPTAEPALDSETYNKYTAKAENPLSLEEWRRTNVNLLISGCHNAIKEINKSIIFSVSPAASAKKNYSELFADVEHWVRNGYVDRIIPQLYFGFDYADENYRFDALLKRWEEISAENDAVELYIGLGFYKTGTENTADGDEWLANDNIIARQTEACRESKYAKGCVLFSYSTVFSDNEKNIKQLEGFKAVMLE